jgi:cysteine desulfurase
VIYLDANASEPLRPAARDAVLAALGLTGNPASIHAQGRAARASLEAARSRIAGCVGAAAADLVFCSGGTEANAMAIAALAPGRRVLVGATEHDAVRAACPGASTLPVQADGTLDLDALRDALRDGAPALVCCMLANNETGVVHPVEAVAALCRAYGALLHVDAVQAAGRMTLDVRRLGADTMALSGHKVGGPKGAGVLVLAPGMALPALIAGGGQERGRRGGTPPLPAIAGFAAALGAAVPPSPALRDKLETAARAEGAVVCGGGTRLANTSCLALPDVRAETQVISLDLAGIAVSAGAACSSGKVTASHVLTAMGMGALAGCAIRVSLPWDVTEDDVAAFVAAYRAMARRLGRT